MTSLPEKMTAVWFAFALITVAHALGWAPFLAVVGGAVVVLPIETWAFLKVRGDD